MIVYRITGKKYSDDLSEPVLQHTEVDGIKGNSRAIYRREQGDRFTGNYSTYSSHDCPGA